MTSPSPTTSQKKARILESARELYLRDGIDGFTMRRVADRAGVGTMTTYRHFSDKDDLLTHVVSEGFGRFQDYFHRALDGEEPYDRLTLCAEHYLRFALEHPKDYELMFMSPGGLGPSPRAAATDDHVARALQFLVDRVAECRGDNPGNTRETALSLWSHCHGLVSLHLAGRYDDDLDFLRFFRRSVGFVLSAFGFSAPDPDPDRRGTM